VKRLRLSDGRILAWRDHGAGPGVPLVLLHGWTLSSAVFTEVLAELGPERPVLAPDLRGHGASDPGPGYGLNEFAADLAEWLRALHHPAIDLVGWSLGGQVALELALAGEVRVRRLVLVAATPRFAAEADWAHGLPDGQIRTMARNLDGDYEGTLSKFFLLQFAGEAMSRHRLRHLADFAVRAAPLTSKNVALAALETLRQTDLRPRLRAVSCPVLVHQGELDRITLPAAAPWLAAALPQGRLRLEPGVGHAPFLSQPREALRWWREFLE
jgi:pimeloyl-[acyl-carrier protein] methyl ester esterase